MAGPARTEQEISTRPTSKVVHLPIEEESWKKKMAKDAEQAAGHPFTPEQATPSSAQPIPTNRTEIPIQPGINTEPIIEDLTDFMGKTGSHVMKYVGGEEGLLAHGETAPGRKGVWKLKERLGKLFRRR